MTPRDQRTTHTERQHEDSEEGESNGSDERQTSEHDNPKRPKRRKGARAGQHRAPRENEGGPQKKEAQTPNNNIFFLTDRDRPIGNLG